MFYASRLLWRPKTLHEMFRRLKLQGAHPDVLWAIDAQKAQHNGEEMIRLETLFHQRATSGVKDPKPQHSFQFWLKPASSSSSSSRAVEAHQLQQVSCTVTPRASSGVVKSQLERLFRDAGIDDDFELDGGGQSMNLERVLRDADLRQTEHIQQTGTLYLRGDKAIMNLRQFGILLVVEEEGMTYLVTLPESTNDVGSSGITGPTGQLSQETEDFLRERNLRSFDLRMAGSYSAVERFVSSFERIEKLYDQHRGLALRPGVCIVLSLKGRSNFVADDGSIVLSMQQMPLWEEYLLSLPGAVWLQCVDMHRQWRLPPAPRLAEQRRKMLRLAEIFHVFGVIMEHRIGGSMLWQEQLTMRLMKEETSIRNAVKKYRLQSDFLKRRGFIHFQEHLTSIVDPTKSIAYRITGEGKIYFNCTATTPQILKVLKENLVTIERLAKEYQSLVSQLEHLSRSTPIDFSVDTDWKRVEDTNVVHCIGRFVQTIKANQAELNRFLGRLLSENTTYEHAGRKASLAPQQKRLVWIISNKFETMPSGVVYVPWDVDFESIKKMLLPTQ